MKSDEEIIMEVLYRKYEAGYEAGKHFYWRRATLKGKPVLIDYERQVVWVESIPLTDPSLLELVFEKDDWHDR